MAKLKIGGTTVTVDDSFRDMPPEQQQAAVEEIAASLNMGSPQQPAVDAHQGEFDALSIPGKIGRAADDLVRQAASGITGGYIDKFAGYMNGTGTEAERRLTDEAHARAPVAGSVAEIGGMLGGLGVAGGAAKSIPAVGKAIAELGSARGAGALATRAGLSAAEGVGIGALDAAGHDQNVEQGAALGGVLGAGGRVLGEGVANAVGGVAGKVGRALKVNNPASREEIKDASQAAYDKAFSGGTLISPKQVNSLKNSIQEQLAKSTYEPGDHPTAKAVVNRLWGKADQHMTLEGLENLRQLSGRAPKDGKDAFMAGKVRDVLDDFMDNLDGSDALKEARRLWAVQKKAETIEAAVENAKISAGPSGSGGNIDNNIRREFAKILKSKKQIRFFTPDEQVTMHLIVKGVKGENLLRAVSKLSPNGNGLMTWLQGAGAMASGGATLPLIGAGVGAKAITDSLTPSRVADLDVLVRSGGKRAAIPPNKLERLSQRSRNALGSAGIASIPVLGGQ